MAPGTAAGAGAGSPTSWRRRGHRVFCPTLTGLGGRSHPIDAKVSLATASPNAIAAAKGRGGISLQAVPAAVFRGNEKDRA
jgi:hypothetical protein